MGVVELILVRHGESAGNVAAAGAATTGREVIDVSLRDADVPLSDTGVEQAQALGDGLRALDQPPDVVWSSPYVRATETTRLALQQAGLELAVHVDERLRDRELGVLDLLTMQGVEARFPEEAQRRRWLGKFYHRPSGGESWADVALRLRTLLADLDRLADGCRVLIVCHDAVVLLVRYVCESLSEAQVLEITSRGSVRNVSITCLTRPDQTQPWELRCFNDIAHLHNVSAPVTEHPAGFDVAPQ